MSSPKNITETSGKKPQIPDNIQISNFVVARFKAGPMVTPEDLVDSLRSRIYFTWKKET